ncbi:hypothetical protein F8568_005625 [Actinomadura sp. LD22]|uniref:Uncharacterized protein n=1 Tax=Actinomadura physcomitrii TaxID=2650748 RepID=A0A6I4M6S9_9ACTN|nr:hypothetical protein [Actinomadura physcomitrii]MVZ99866.1 hypothetical protein [Actinomadura physcomitrii]
MPLQPLLVNDAWDRIDAAAEKGDRKPIELETFFIGQVVGGFTELRPAGEITRRIAADCERRLRDLARILDATAGPV